MWFEQLDISEYKLDAINKFVIKWKQCSSGSLDLTLRESTHRDV